MEPSAKRHNYLSHVEIISNYVKIIGNYVEINRRLDAGSMPSATAIATKNKRSAENLAHAHLCREHNCNYVLLTQLSRRKQHEGHTITTTCKSLLIMLK